MTGFVGEFRLCGAALGRSRHRRHLHAALNGRPFIDASKPWSSSAGST